MRRYSYDRGNAKVLSELLDCEPQLFIEFDAAAKGVQILLEEQNIHIQQYIFTNVGTGTSLHFSDNEGQNVSAALVQVAA